MGFFNNSGANEYHAELEKALSAGYGTDSAQFTDGRALIPEDCEQETLNILAMSKEDCKVMSTIKKQPVKSTVHEKNVRESEGDFMHLTVREGGLGNENSQKIKRKTYPMKFLQDVRSVTTVMQEVNAFEEAYASEKISGINTILKGSEFLCFHGNSEVVDTEFDGFETQIRKADKKHQNIIDLRGQSIGAYGEKLFDEIAEKVFRNGGSIEKALFPPVLAKDIKSLFEDRIRFAVEDKSMSFKTLSDYPTATGQTIRLSGEDAGADKFYFPKGKVVADGDPQKRPPMPASVTATAATKAGSMFSGADAGNYKYTVHAVNAAGTSDGKEISAPIAVASGEGVELAIEAGSGNETTGYIICRSNKNGTEAMELTRIGIAPNEDDKTVFTDLNIILPGTASMLFLTENKVESIYKFGQLMGMRTIPLGRNSASDRFIVAMFGGLELYGARFCGIAQNISYKGGLY